MGRSFRCAAPMLLALMSSRAALRLGEVARTRIRTSQIASIGHFWLMRAALPSARPFSFAQE
jgi:hypothetical protein